MGPKKRLLTTLSIIGSALFLPAHLSHHVLIVLLSLLIVDTVLSWFRGSRTPNAPTVLTGEKVGEPRDEDDDTEEEAVAASHAAHSASLVMDRDRAPVVMKADFAVDEPSPYFRPTAKSDGATVRRAWLRPLERTASLASSAASLASSSWSSVVWSGPIKAEYSPKPVDREYLEEIEEEILQKSLQEAKALRDSESAADEETYQGRQRHIRLTEAGVVKAAKEVATRTAGGQLPSSTQAEYADLGARDLVKRLGLHEMDEPEKNREMIEEWNLRLKLLGLDEEGQLSPPKTNRDEQTAADAISRRNAVTLFGALSFGPFFAAPYTTKLNRESSIDYALAWAETNEDPEVTKAREARKARRQAYQAAQAAARAQAAAAEAAANAVTLETESGSVYVCQPRN